MDVLVVLTIPRQILHMNYKLSLKKRKDPKILSSPTNEDQAKKLQIRGMKYSKSMYPYWDQSSFTDQ